MNIKKLEEKKELIAEKVHDAWLIEKARQGFHAPEKCKSNPSKEARSHDLRSHGLHPFLKFHKYCDKCHTDMYPYAELPENIKDYDRVTVDAVLKAISEI